MARKVLIACYGTKVDRQRLEALALASGVSQSSILRDFIRDQYSDHFGDKNPEDVLSILEKNQVIA